MPSFFPIKGYSQSEIIEYAREPLARLSLLDALIDISGEQDAILKAKADLRRNATDLLQHERERERADKQLMALPGLREEIQRLSAFLKNPEVRKQEAWQEERAVFDAFVQALHTLGDNVADDTLFQVHLPADDDLPAEPVNADLLNRLGELRDDVAHALTSARERLGQAIREFERPAWFRTGIRVL